jgi:acyl-CoA dehydrogenase
VAISEPKVGAHPRDLRTCARRDGDSWIVEGEKAWVTNGPIADLFIVLAITNSAQGRKQYSAFLVPRETPGLELLDMPELTALRPSQHCRLRLDGCRVAATAMLGAPGIAYETMALPFRDVEDAVGLSGIAGLGRFIARGLADLAGPGAATEVHAALGEISGLLAVLDATARQLAERLDQGTAIANGHDDLLIGARAVTQHLSGCISRLRDRLPATTGELATACDDLVFSLGIARGPRAMKQTRLGASLVVGSRTG